MIAKFKSANAIKWPFVCLFISLISFILVNAVSQFVINSIGLKGSEIGAPINALASLLPVFVVYKLVIARLGRNPRDDLAWSAMLPGAGAGIVVGFVLFSIVVATAYILGVYQIVGEGSGEQLMRSLLGLGLVTGLVEELIFRGILFRWIEEMGGSWVALAVTSVLFGLAHGANPGATWFSTLAVSVEAGVLLGGAYMMTRNLWFAAGIHAAWNFAQGFLYGVPVSGNQTKGLVIAELSGSDILSGGTFGLEASLISMVVATTVGLAFIVTAVKRGDAVGWRDRQLPPSLDLH